MRESATYHEEADRRVFFRRAFKALAFNQIDGDYVEFGSCGGMTFQLAYHESRRAGHFSNLWSFDSFAGLPAQQRAEDAHPVWTPGHMTTYLEEFLAICARNGIPRAVYRVVPGYYAETLATTATGDRPSNIALAYIDCDMYSSTMSVIKFLLPRMKHGMVLAFDDYFCWSPTQVSGERRAAYEVLENHAQWRLVPFIQFGWHGLSFVVEDRSLLNNLMEIAAERERDL